MRPLRPFRLLASDSRTRRRDAIEASESTNVIHKLEEQEKVTEAVADSDGSNSTSRKQESSVVSAVLATACIAAVAFEAISESRHKEHSEHTEVKLDDRIKVSHDCDTPFGTEPAMTIEDNQTLTIEEDVVANRTVRQSAVVNSPVPLKTTTMPTPAAVACGEAQTEVYRSRYVKSDIFFTCSRY